MPVGPRRVDPHVGQVYDGQAGGGADGSAPRSTIGHRRCYHAQWKARCSECAENKNHGESLGTRRRQIPWQAQKAAWGKAQGLAHRRQASKEAQYVRRYLSGT